MWILVFQVITILGVLCDHTPGAIQVGDNLYFDKTEISQRNYKEYLSWLIRTFGDESPMWKNALPGITRIDSNAGVKQILPSPFFLDDKYDGHPIVNVSFEQATSYCQWRSDRVYEMVLVTLGIIEYNPQQDANNFFTIKKYMDTIPGDSSFIAHAIYRLPTPEEWDAIAQHKLVIKKFQTDYKDIKPRWEDKISDMYGGVAEMTSTRGLSKGGSFKDPIPDISDRLYDSPGDWLGFRCICSIALENKNAIHFEKFPRNKNYATPIRVIYDGF